MGERVGGKKTIWDFFLSIQGADQKLMADAPHKHDLDASARRQVSGVCVRFVANAAKSGSSCAGFIGVRRKAMEMGWWGCKALMER